MTLTKSRIVDNVCAVNDLSRAQSAEIVNGIFETLKKNLESGNDVVIRGFGKFSVRENLERRGRQTSYGNDLVPEAKRIVTFRCSPVLKDKINNSQ